MSSRLGTEFGKPRKQTGHSAEAQKAAGLSFTAELPLPAGLPCPRLAPPAETIPLRQGATLTRAEASGVSPGSTCVQLS